MLMLSQILAVAIFIGGMMAMVEGLDEKRKA